MRYSTVMMLMMQSSIEAVTAFFSQREVSMKRLVITKSDGVPSWVCLTLGDQGVAEFARQMSKAFGSGCSFSKARADEMFPTQVCQSIFEDFSPFGYIGMQKCPKSGPFNTCVVRVYFLRGAGLRGRESFSGLASRDEDL